MYKLALTVGAIFFAMSFLTNTTAGEKKEPPSININGKWMLVGNVVNGKEKPAEVPGGAKEVLSFEDGKYKETVDEKTVGGGTYKIDATRSPASIDLTITEGRNKGKLQLGLVMLKGDVLTLALAKAGSKDRPKGFEGGDGVENWASVYKRK